MHLHLQIFHAVYNDDKQMLLKQMERYSLTCEIQARIISQKATEEMITKDEYNGNPLNECSNTALLYSNHEIWGTLNERCALQ